LKAFDVGHYRRALRSIGSSRLVVATSQTVHCRSRAFPISAIQLWNSLPDDVISCDFLSISGVISNTICSIGPIPMLYYNCSA